MLSASFADGILSQRQQARLLEKPHTVVYSQLMADGRTRVQVRNIADGGFVLTQGDRILGYSDTGTFRPDDAPPALLDMLQALGQQTPESLLPSSQASRRASGVQADALSFEPTGEPLLGDIRWNQDAPYNDLCPKYDMSTRCPTGCVATAMAQLMRYHRWPLQGVGSHTYSPAILSGNTLTADFGATAYQWDAMLPNYATADAPAEGYTMDECRQAVAQLMQHCGVAVDMVYYTQSGATDYDVPPALIGYFNYDRSMSYRKREHYGTVDWLQILHDEFAAGRPVLAYGRASAGGHAYVFDGMDQQGFIHVNWGWGGMSNGYFSTSALTPASQGIGGSDGGFNYTQRIITGIFPADGIGRDYDVELTSTEGLTAGKAKIAQGSDVTIRLSGKVYNHGWQTADFDYALLLLSEEGDTVCIVPGPAAQQLEKDATAYAPTFGAVNFGVLAPGSYTLYPVCRMTGGTGRWLRIRDNYIGYVNRLDVTATEADVTFRQPDYFELKATDTDVPDVIYSGVPTLITATVTNEGDVEYHGEVKVQLRQGSSIVATTSNYIVDLLPGAATQLRFTDGFKAAAGSYTLCLVDDDGTVISPRFTVTVSATPAVGTVVAATPLTVDKIRPDQMQVTATVAASGGFFGGLLYTFIMNKEGRKEVSCLFPEYIMLNADGTPQQVIMRGTFENGVPGTTYQAQLAVYDGSSYTFLDDANATCTFVFSPETQAVEDITRSPSDGSAAAFDLGGRPVGSHSRGITVSGGKKMLRK